jgi:ABC-type Mn2+/Zn2+ transport system ATPase subunit
LIRVEELTAGYGDKLVISRLSFLAQSQDSPLVLAGRNGSGKSTLLKAILGQIPFSGKIELSNPNQSIGWIPQSYQLSLSIPVIDFVALGASIPEGLFASLPKNAKSLAEEALVELKLEHLTNKRTDELSGGEWQLVCLAQLMVQETDIWLLDEPTSSLDIYYKSFVFELLWKKAKEGKMIILSTHDLPFLPNERGKILLFGGGFSNYPISKVSLEETLFYLSSKAKDS